MTCNFSKRVDRHHTHSTKWDHAELRSACLKGRNDILNFWIADMDFEVADPIQTAIEKRVEHKIFGYSEIDSDYLEIIQHWHDQQYGLKLSIDEIFYSPGVVAAIGICLRMITEAGDQVMVHTPAYYPFFGIIENNNLEVVDSQLINKDGYYTIDFEDFEAKAKDERLKVFILCNPHNPVGRVWSKAELERLADICHRHNVMILSDEIHCDILRPGQKHVSMSTVKGVNKDKVITFTSVSKGFNLAGFAIANVLIHNAVYKELWQQNLYGCLGIKHPTVLAVDAVKAAYSDEGLKWLKELRLYIDQNMKFVDQYIAENLPKIRFRVPEGTFLAWLDFSAYDSCHEEIVRRLYNHGIVLDDGKIYRCDKKNQRLNVACPSCLLKEGLDRLYVAMKDCP